MPVEEIRKSQPPALVTLPLPVFRAPDVVVVLPAVPVVVPVVVALGAVVVPDAPVEVVPAVVDRNSPFI